MPRGNGMLTNSHTPRCRRARLRPPPLVDPLRDRKEARREERGVEGDEKRQPPRVIIVVRQRGGERAHDRDNQGEPNEREAPPVGGEGGPAPPQDHEKRQKDGKLS